MTGERPGSGWVAFNSTSRRWRWTFGGGIWLIFLAPAVSDALHGQHGDLVKALTLLDYAVFGAVYLLCVPFTAFRHAGDPVRHAVPALALALGLLALPGTGEDGLATFVYVAVIAVGLLPPRVAFGWAGLLASLAAVLSYTVPGWSRDPASILFSILLATVASSSFIRLLRRNAELAIAREDLAELAVEQERARFARDLHDLLGHSLTVITVKSELAGRLLPRDPDRAAVEVADIERLAREALADVRKTVAGYREVTLAAEVSAARSALSAAGIAAQLPGALDDIPGDRRELFGWVVREGVTNVVRHSNARQVTIAVSPRTVEVVDDGTVCPQVDGGPAEHGGHGLDGLRERLTQVGGRLEAGPLSSGGYRLFAEVPA